MIDLAPSGTLLDRFVRDLDAQAPRPLDLQPELERGDARDRRCARFAWAARVVDEYRSVVVFSELQGCLARAEAPFDALCAVQRLIGDELRHARLCAAVSDWFGPFDALTVDLSDLALPPTDDAPEVRAVEIVARELVVAEDESVRVLRAYRDATTDPACHRALSILLVDEVRHAAAGRALFDRLVAAFAGRLDDLLERLPATLARDRAHIVAQHQAGADGAPGRMFGASIRPDEAPAPRTARVEATPPDVPR